MAFEDLPGREVLVGDEVGVKTSADNDSTIIDFMEGDLLGPLIGYAASVLTRNLHVRLAGIHERGIPLPFEQAQLLKQEGGDGLGRLRELSRTARDAQNAVVEEAKKNVVVGQDNFALTVNRQLSLLEYRDSFARMLAVSLGAAAEIVAERPPERFKEIGDAVRDMRETASSVSSGVGLLGSAFWGARSRREPLMVAHFPGGKRAEALALDAQAIKGITYGLGPDRNGESFIHDKGYPGATGNGIYMTANYGLGESREVEVSQQARNTLDLPYTRFASPVWAIRNAADIMRGRLLDEPFAGLDGVNVQASPDIVVLMGLDRERVEVDRRQMLPRREVIARMASIAQQELGLEFPAS